ncbi:MAG: hypothetical protein P4L72_09125 [Parvibaculum sp.]|uniref:hypothetical protein n=1 Tax=Parvibaculum sp. TaxID=2024848 RepID=UPI00284ACFE9|nr:hypothetical protein [Parvibaculum sp.]MDR3499375.1 hypothetical protein [Parvibaculum sp.]
MIRRGLLVAVSLCVILGAMAWKIGTMRGQAASAAEISDTTGPAAQGQGQTYAAIAGFRSAKFGETEDAVRAAISTDFGKSGDDVKVVENPVERTKALIVEVSDLVPETGKARVTYVLGYKSKALIQVNVLWGTPIVPDTTAVGIGRTGLVLKSYFARQNFDPKFTIRDRKLKNGVLVFQSRDAQGHLVRLVYIQAPIGKPKPASADEAAAAEKKSIYLLNLSYVANPAAPDILTIKEGDF